jgi:hypothetical protein
MMQIKDYRRDVNDVGLAGPPYLKFLVPPLGGGKICPCSCLWTVYLYNHEDCKTGIFGIGQVLL